MFVVSCIVWCYIQKRENIATPSGYIFVFVDEVFNKISEVFQSANKTVLCPSDYAPKYFPEKCPDLQLQT